MTDPKESKKEIRYDYFVNPNNQMCPNNSEFKPTKVTEPTSSGSEGRSPYESAWNSCGTWEEHKLEGTNLGQFIDVNKGETQQTFLT